jgi:EAL domain-containing protein (putative c-di-GMP-specific phosphodiesterase class I)
LGKDWPWLLAGAILVGVALSVAAYALGSGSTTVTMLSVALIALALGQIVGLLRSYSRTGVIVKLAESQADIVDAVGRMSNDARRINAENINLARNVEQFRIESTELNNSLSESFASLRQGHEAVADNLKSILESQKEIQSSITRRNEQSTLAQSNINEAIAREQQWMAQIKEMPDVAVEPPAPPSFEQSGLADQLNLSLEPVVDLFTSNTAHYRMHLGMTNEQGQDVAHDIFIHHADRLGLRDQLDQHVIEQSLALLEQLRQRDSALSIFVPVGAVTLSNPQAVQNIIGMLKAAPQHANGIVLDMPHASLASLSDASLEGLATFARAGVLLSLSQASIAGIDLPSLSRLNVRWISLAASSVGIGARISAGLPGFVQSARAMRIQVVISHLGDPRQVQGLARTARFASGPAFAMPRKLKRTDTEDVALTAAA